MKEFLTACLIRLWDMDVAGNLSIRKAKLSNKTTLPFLKQKLHNLRHKENQSQNHEGH